MSSTFRSPRAAWSSWLLQLLAAGILGQTLYFKFTGAPEAVALFEALGAEPWGRYVTGGLEAVAVVLLLSGRGSVLGALLASVLMVGAVGAHLTRLGIEVNDDGGALFLMALVTLFGSLVVIYLRRRQLPWSGKSLP